jgi:hypothetical protein
MRKNLLLPYFRFRRLAFFVMAKENQEWLPPMKSGAFTAHHR